MSSTGRERLEAVRGSLTAFDTGGGATAPTLHNLQKQMNLGKSRPESDDLDWRRQICFVCKENSH